VYSADDRVELMVYRAETLEDAGESHVACFNVDDDGVSVQPQNCQSISGQIRDTLPDLGIRHNRYIIINS
jgi:hypothetical protein